MLLRKALRWTVVAVATAVTLCLVVFGLLQTWPGKDFLAAQISRLASNARFTWEINGLGGTVPFDMTAQRLTVTDNEGTWLTLRDVGLDIEPAGLLSKKLHIRLLRVGAWDQARPPSGRSPSLAELLQTPHLPFNLAVDRLVIDRLQLAPPVSGTSVIATLAGGVAFEKGDAHVDLDIHRIDGSPGNVRLALTLAGETPRLSLQLHASDPTGIIADRIFVRTNHVPLALSIDGDGFVSNWHGRLTFSAGPKARADADLALAVSAETALDLSARADVAALLPPALASIIGDRGEIGAACQFRRANPLRPAFVRDRLRHGNRKWRVGGPGAGVAAHLRAELPDLSKLATIAGTDLSGSAVLTAEISGTKQRPVLAADLAASDVEFSGARTKTVAAHIVLTPSGALDDPQTRIAVAGQGRVNAARIVQGGAFVARLGHQIEWSLTECRP